MDRDSIKERGAHVCATHRPSRNMTAAYYNNIASFPGSEKQLDVELSSICRSMSVSIVLDFMFSIMAEGNTAIDGVVM
jgi:hypothetical protein